MTAATNCASFTQPLIVDSFKQMFTPQQVQYGAIPRTAVRARKPVSGSTTIFQSEPAATWSIRLSKNIERLRRLPPGWDGPRSLPINNALLNRVNALIREALAPLGKDARAPFVVPLPTGGVQVEWHTIQGELELELAADGTTAVWIRDHSTEYEFETEGVKALNQFLHWVPRLAQERPDVVNVSAAPNPAPFAVAA